MDHDDFIAAIRADPTDDGPRLVYSDWLQEQGDPYGEFVLAQCRAAAGAGSDWADRAARLLAEYEPQWTAELRRAGAEQIVFRRGAVDEFKISGRRLRAFDDLFALAPLVRHLRVRSAHLGFPFRFESPAFGQLTSLTLRVGSLLPDAAAQLAEADHLAGLRALDLHGNRLGDTGVAQLVGNPRFTGLRHLNLTANGLGEAAAELVASAPFARGLKRLEIGMNRLTDHGARAFTETDVFDGLEWLDLMHIGVSEQRAQVLRDHFRWRSAIHAVRFYREE